MNTAGAIVDNPDGTRTEYFDMAPDEQALLAILRELFEVHWQRIIFGICIQGAVFEVRSRAQPRVGYLDGYVTVGVDDERAGHFHLCIGPHRGSATRPTPPELAAWRRCARAAFFRDSDAQGRHLVWGFRMWNGRGEQMLNLFFPNPWLDPDTVRPVGDADWSQLDLWMQARERWSGVPAEPPPMTGRPDFH